jgi:hypothetical protein
MLCLGVIFLSFTTSGEAIVTVPISNDIKLISYLTKTGYASQNEAQQIVQCVRSSRYSVLLLAIMMVESEAKADTRTADNHGLMQVSEVHLQKNEIKRLDRHPVYKPVSVCGVTKVQDLYDIPKNICAADIILSRLQEECDGDIWRAVTRYNASKNRKSYIKKVKEQYETLLEIVGEQPLYSKLQ